MIYIIYFTNYGNCKQIAEIIKMEGENGKKGVKLENGEVIAPKDVLAWEPELVLFGAPIRNNMLTRQGREWLNRFAAVIRARNEQADRQLADKSGGPVTVKPWRGKISIFFTHRFAEGSFKIEINIKKYLKHLHIDTKHDTDKGKAETTLLDITVAPFVDVLVSKATGPLEQDAGAKVKAGIKAIALSMPSIPWVL